MFTPNLLSSILPKPWASITLGRKFAPALYLPIHHLFSLSLSHQCLPAEWCIHSIVPVFKSGDRTSIINYRPITLLCTISLVLEHHIYNKALAIASGRISSSKFSIWLHQKSLYCSPATLIYQSHFFLLWAESPDRCHIP